jgi:hypothetical protein
MSDGHHAHSGEGSCGGLLLASTRYERSIERNIAEAEAAEAILRGKIIEEYPDDKYGPSCLIFGRTRRARPIHVQCCLPPEIWIITVYEPDPNEWIDFSKRKE